jgi:hypothetical protein
VLSVSALAPVMVDVSSTPGREHEKIAAINEHGRIVSEKRHIQGGTNGFRKYRTWKTEIACRKEPHR